MILPLFKLHRYQLHISSPMDCKYLSITLISGKFILVIWLRNKKDEKNKKKIWRVAKKKNLKGKKKRKGKFRISREKFFFTPTVIRNRIWLSILSSYLQFMNVQVKALNRKKRQSVTSIFSTISYYVLHLFNA